MSGPLHAGERVLPQLSDARPARPSGRGGGPSGTPPRRTPPPRRPLFGAVRRLLGVALALALVGAVVAGLVGWRAYERFAADLPTLDGLRNYQPRTMSRVYAGNDRLMAELATERRIFVPYAAIPDLVKKAFISAEDQNFWVHRGVDPLAMARAAVTDLTRIGESRRPVGASTITQQVAKNMLLSNEVSFARKAKEAILAIRIEQSLSKERILELYLNEIYLGEKAYGVVAAAQTYFDKPLDQLNPAEAALLAALPKAPNNYDPFRNPDAARSRRDWVLDRMVDTHAITAQAAQQAHARPVPSQGAGMRRVEIVGGSEWFTDEVRRQLVDRFGADQTTQGGLVVHTSLDPVLQDAGDRALRAGLLSYDRGHDGWRGPVTHLAQSVDAAPRGGRRTAAAESTGTGWQPALAGVARPGGMLDEWVLAMVLDVAGERATLGWTASGGVARTGTMALSDTSWARPLRGTVLGPAPRRMADVVQPGDVVMAELTQPSGRLQLRQIPVVQGALVSLDPATGRVLALSGGFSFGASQFNRATQAQRQPGSSFKPFVYLTGMEQGISPSARFDNSAFSRGDWHPNNYEMTYGGLTSLHVALMESLNLVTVRLADKVGMDTVAETATALGEVTGMPHVLPAALGAVDTTVLREAGAYASLETGGRLVSPSVIDSVQDRTGRLLWRSGAGLTCAGCTPDPADAGARTPDTPVVPPTLTDDRKRVADAASTFQVVQMMKDVVAHGTGTPAGKGIDRPVAGKTGTSQDFNDAWFAGFTPNLVTVVWVGYDAPASLGQDETGGALAGPIWNRFMLEALKDRPRLDFPVPEGVTLKSWSSSRGTVTDAFKPDQVPGAGGVAGDPVASSSGGGGGSGGGDTGLSASSADAGPVSAGGVDSGMGGLY